MGRLLAALIILLQILPDNARAQEQESISQVKYLMESCQFSQASTLAERILSKDSTQTDLLLLLGRALAAQFQYREAIVIIGEALKADSTNVLMLNELANVYRQSGDPGRAISTTRKMTELNPGNRYFRLQLANLYYAGDDFRLAAQVLLPLYRSDSSSFFIAKQLGNCFNELKRSDSAILFYRRALKIIPYDPYVTGKLANIYIREDFTAMALYLTETFLAQDSSNIAILKQNGYCYYLLIDFRQATTRFTQCLQLGDSSKFTMKYLGLSYYKQEKYDTAVPFFRSAFYSDTTDAEVCFYYGVSACRSLAVDTGLAYLNRTLRLLMPPGKFLSTLYTELAYVNTSKGEADTALFFLKKALEANPENNTLRFKIAYQYDFHLRMPFEGLPYYREFLKNASQEDHPGGNLPQQVSYTDYAKNRIGEIAGKRKR